MPMITVEVRSVYGKTMYYPQCEPAKTFARLTNHTTLTREDIKLIRELGYAVDFVHAEVTI